MTEARPRSKAQRNKKPRGVSAWRVKTNVAHRTEIERALDEMISDEVGNKFQGLAVVRAQQKWPRLVACERKWDGGLDAHANGALEPDGNGLGLACSTTATIKKVKGDAAKTKEHYPDVRVLIFATPKKVSQHTKRRWAKQIADEFGLLLQVVSREEFVVWLLDPAHSDICRDQLGITEPSVGRNRLADRPSPRARQSVRGKDRHPLAGTNPAHQGRRTF